MAKRVTVLDVAEAAGVSTGTVSAVINARSSVRDTTRQQVMDAIRDLEYRLPRSSPLARRASEDGAERPRSVGVIIKEADNPFYADVLLGVRAALEESGAHLLLGTSEGSFEEEGRLIQAFRERHADGVIVAPVLDEHVDLSHLFTLRRTGFPFVLLGDVHGLQAASVTVDNVKASKAAVRHLIEGGHERIVHVSGPQYSQHSRDRVAGVKEAFSESPLQFHDDVVVPGGARLEDGYRVALDVFGGDAGRGGERPTAITCFNDLVAMGALRALAELGLSVPGDVSVVGYDDIQMAAYLATPLTTVRVPTREMGRRAAALLDLQLSSDAPAPPERVVLDAELVERASTRSL
ncbi:LacI family DNA-binding transcriptional regulator [Rubrivirga sp. S365]|uniref:LacI family DNA-binding transcriptional regulator n=1 Tax=Rubrivirga litoralis TaxID=3075598 RepID=A0ABU3BNW6_9BACT|nr:MULTISPECIES: LacI family DNA-binding transcriptional regulator [unclassified Rubrivirga]MDT0630906.1 LacI family DNA-binding transcriptional regulator [Rubrivirga sp. F394]MDT7856549.1 LacI family DNA-binding transcriptional regulator [Rubrivirga sp. S365]